jgi:hypothetical protein
MYACIFEIRRGIFTGVCAAGHRSPFSCDPPLSAKEEDWSPTEGTPVR